MSLFEDNRYRWRETYFVLFDQAKRPSLEAIRGMLAALAGRYELDQAHRDVGGDFESVTVLSPEDYSALDLSYIAGEEVLEQTAGLVEEINPADELERQKLGKLAAANARLDVMHFEQLSDDPALDDEDEMLDPSALLIVLDQLVELTDGVAFDPQSGVLM